MWGALRTYTEIAKGKEGRCAHPARHRLEASATNIFLSRRGATPLFFTENRFFTENKKHTN